MKFLQFACLFVALFAFGAASNAFWGNRVAGDFLLMKDTIRNNGTKNAYTSADVYFPKSGQTNNRTITAVYVYDLYPRQRGASPALWSGGVGYRFATINLKSQYNSGINSTVEIYGR